MPPEEGEMIAQGRALLPEHNIKAVFDYIQKGELPGDFLQAVICDQLFEACARADHINMLRLHGYVNFFYNFAPADCWGSKEKMEAWSERMKAKQQGEPCTPA